MSEAEVSHTEAMIALLSQKLADEKAVTSMEAPDPFKGEQPGFEEYSKYRETGELPERFKAADQTVAPAAPKEGETVEGKEPSETEQEKIERERDEKGKFKAKSEEKDPLFTPEQQKAFDKAFAKREAKLRREYETRYATQTSSSPQGTAPAKEPETVATGEPQKPELPKLSTYKGTVEEYEKELGEYPAKLEAFYQAQRKVQERAASVEKRMADSQAKTQKAHPDYMDEYQALVNDILSNDEPKMPNHVLNAIMSESEDPHELTYHLAKNREEFRRFASLSPEQTLREVLKLDFKIATAPPAPVQAEPKRKPAPPEPVGARASSSAFDVNDEKIDADEWARQRNEQLRKTGRR